jgi:hypothetical protein
MEPIVSSVIAYVGLVGLPALVAVAVTLWVVHLARDAISERVKVAIKADYDERLETIKAQLKASADTELEGLKHELALEALRHDVRYTKLHEIRASVIADVYALLSEAYAALKDYTVAFEIVGIPSKADRAKVLAEKLNLFAVAFKPKKIFFPTATADRLEEINQSIVQTATTFELAVVPMERQIGQAEAWLKVLQKVDGPITTALRELESEFRKIMGEDTW